MDQFQLEQAIEAVILASKLPPETIVETLEMLLDRYRDEAGVTEEEP
jgi:hypothetical protein